jgi:hypothetical protein
MAVCLTVVQCAVSRPECLAVARLVCCVKARVLGRYAPRSPLRAARVLCHGCVLDRGSVRCVKARVPGCCAFSVLCQGKSAWLLCVQARAQPLLSAWMACLECAVPCAWIGAVGVKARLLGCYSFTVLCQGKSVCVMRVGCALSRQECLCYACRQCAVGVLEYCCERVLVVLVPWAE